ncbi:MAG: hypothetical protein WC812_02595 [Candidatus Pacearchaeota archaeon]|jgi:hypothetical protein
MVEVEKLSVGAQIKIKPDSWGYCSEIQGSINYPLIPKANVLEIYIKDKKVLVQVEGQNEKVKYSIDNILEIC